MTESSPRGKTQSGSGTQASSSEKKISEETLKRVRKALLESEGFGEGRVNGIVAALYQNGVHLVSQ